MSTAEFWISDSGDCWLKGVYGDATNPLRLPDNTIVEILRMNPRARESFNRLYPTLLPDEKIRLDQIARSAQFMQPDEKRVEDDFQRAWNTARVVPRGPGSATAQGRG